MRRQPSTLPIGPAWTSGLIVSLAAAAGVCAAVVPAALAAQAQPGTLAARVERATGGAAFEIPLRPGVEICDRGGITTTGWRSGRHHMRDDCGPGPAIVVVERGAGGAITDLSLQRQRPAAHVAYLGAAAGPDVADFMFALAPAVRRRVAGDALMITTLVDGVDPAPRLLDLARDRALGSEVRRAALFWVAQVASDRVGEHLAGIASAEAEDQEVRNAAVFALSQRPETESVPALMELAQEAPHVRTRRQALFWLAQSDDPRVADFFADLILRGPLGG